MSLLTERLPETVEIDGAHVPVNADFRVILRIDEMRESEVGESERGVEALRLFYGYIPQNIETAAERMLWFMQCGRQGEGGEQDTPQKPDFSFSHDAGLIASAFFDQYGIDLAGILFLHWWQFRALLEGLRAEHLFCEVRRIRSMDLGKVKDKEQRRYYSKMKRIYALPLPEGERERLDAITDALMHGGDVAALLGAD